MDLLWTHRWWEYSAETPIEHLVLNHYFNLLEFIAWETCALFVCIRHLRNRKSKLELLYSLLFAIFGLTDVREAYALESWLIWIKLGNLIALFWVRHVVIRRFYPDAKMN